MAYVRQPPPSIEAMLDQFADWMAQHAQAKVTVTIDYRDGSSTTTEVDHRGPKKPKTPNVERNRPAAGLPDDGPVDGSVRPQR